MEFDDGCDATVSKIPLLLKLKELMPGLKVTIFMIPNRCSDETIAAFRALGHWCALGMHGWEHTLGEQWSITSEEIMDKMQLALARGIDAKVFRAPKWVIDNETYVAAKQLNWVVADHAAFRVLGTGARTYCYNDPALNPKWTRVHGHLPNVSGNGIEETFNNFVFPPEAEFLHITEAV